jgi:hypothetical protein
MRYRLRRRRDGARFASVGSQLYGVTADQAEVLMGTPNTVFVVRDAVSGRWGVLCNLCRRSLSGTYERSEEAAIELGIHLERRHPDVDDVALGIYESVEAEASVAPQALPD